MLAGCQKPVNRITIETFAEPLRPERYATDFPEAYFAETPRGGLEILLRWRQPSSLDPTQQMEQVVHIETFWKPRYGTTRAEATMINARLRFAILTPPTGVAYEGGGFLTCTMSRDGSVLDATLESGNLAPARVAGGAKEPFGPARVSGVIRAVRDRRNVVLLRQEAERKLGS